MSAAVSGGDTDGWSQLKHCAESLPLLRLPSQRPVVECLSPVGMLREAARRAACDAVGPERSDALLRELVASFAVWWRRRHHMLPLRLPCAAR